MKTKTVTPLKVPENLKLDEPLEMLEITQRNMKEVSQLWQESYQKVYPSYQINPDDPYNQHAHILCTKNVNNEIVSTARIIMDSPLGFPDDDIYPKEIKAYRQKGLKLAELGRCINTDRNQKINPYFKAIYQLAKAERIDAIVITLKDKDVPLYQRLIGADCLSTEMETDNGGKFKMTCMYWDLAKTKERFFTRVGLSTTEQGVAS